MILSLTNSKTNFDIFTRFRMVKYIQINYLEIMRFQEGTSFLKLELA